MGRGKAVEKTTRAAVPFRCHGSGKCRQKADAPRTGRRLGSEGIKLGHAVKPEGLDEPGERATGKPAWIFDKEATAGVAMRLDQGSFIDDGQRVHGADHLGRSKGHDHATGPNDAGTERIREI